MRKKNCSYKCAFEVKRSKRWGNINILRKALNIKKKKIEYKGKRLLLLQLSNIFSEEKIL